MKTPATTTARRLIAALAVVSLAPCALLQAQEPDFTAGNLTVQQQAYFGSIYTDIEATNIAEGLRLDASQDTAEVYRSSTTPGYWQDNWVTVEDWGWIETGHWENTTEWQIVGYDTIPATYDENGNVITPETQEPRWDWVITSSTWVVDSSTWSVTGTHQENQQIWQEEQTNSWTETTSGGTPRVRFNATRSDTNFAFRVPAPGYGSDNMKDILVLWEGGLTLPNVDPYRTSVFTSGALQQNWFQQLSNGSRQNYSNARAESTTLTTIDTWTDSGGYYNDTTENESRPEFVRLTRTENTNGVSTVAQTQIAAKSASFAGVVEIAGDAKVQGKLLIAPQGDLTMGPYTAGPQP